MFAIASITELFGWLRSNLGLLLVLTSIGLFALWRHAASEASHAQEWRALAQANAEALKQLQAQHARDLAAIEFRQAARDQIAADRERSTKDANDVADTVLSPAVRDLLERLRNDRADRPGPPHAAR